jgi:hypothetical protein
MGNKHNAISRIKGTRSVYEVNRCDGGREGGRQERRRQGRREAGEEETGEEGTGREAGREDTGSAQPVAVFLVRRQGNACIMTAFSWIPPYI